MELKRHPALNYVGLGSAMAAAALVALLLPINGQLAYTGDSIHYTLAASAITNGHGVSIFNFSLTDPGFAPFTMWPPLYPLVLASGVPPLLIQTILLSAIAGIAYWLLIRYACLNWLPACVLAIIVTLPWPIIMDANYVWTELLAVFWVFVALAATMRLFETAHRTDCHYGRYWILTALALAAAVYTRYAFLVFIPGIVPALLAVPVTWRRRALLALATPSLAAILISPLLLRNLFATGHISGATRATSQLHAGNTLSLVVNYLNLLFGSVHWQRGAFLLSIVGLMIVVAVVGTGSRRVHDPDTPDAQRAKWLAWGATSLALAYAIGVAVLRAWKTFTLTTRLTSPIAPLLLLALSAWASVIWHQSFRSSIWVRAALVTPLAALLSLSIVTTRQMTVFSWHNWRTTGSPQWPAAPPIVYKNLQYVATPPLSGVSVAHRPDLMAFQTGWDCRHFPNPPWTADDLAMIAQKATAVIVDDPESQRLARALWTMVPNARLAKIRDVPVILWGEPQTSFGEAPPP